MDVIYGADRAGAVGGHPGGAFAEYEEHREAFSYPTTRRPRGPVAESDLEFVSVQTPEQAWWLEARLEHHLGLVDRRVEGEHMPGPGLGASSRAP